MLDREMVIEGFEMSYRYSNVDENNTLVPQQLVLDALALLKAQEPRLVTEKDFENADAYGYIPAWCETKDDLYCECIMVGALEEEGCRYWTSKPTKEQMEALKWE